MDLDALRAELADAPSLGARGRVRAVTGLSLSVSLPGARVGDLVIVRRRGEPLWAEVVGFRDAEVVTMPLGDITGVGPEDVVESTGGPLSVPVGPALLGRVHRRSRAAARRQAALGPARASASRPYAAAGAAPYSGARSDADGRARASTRS